MLKFFKETGVPLTVKGWNIVYQYLLSLTSYNADL